MHLLATCGFMLWTAVALAAPSPKDLPSGDVESLREMVKKKEYRPADPDTLPFPALRDPDLHPVAVRSRACAQCMWQLLMLVRILTSNDPSEKGR